MRRDQLFGTAYLSSKSTLFPLFFIKHFHLQASKQMNAAANQLLLCCFVLFEVCRVPTFGAKYSKCKSFRKLGGRHSSVDPSAPTILRPGFKSQAHLIFFQLIFELRLKRTNKRKYMILPEFSRN